MLSPHDLERYGRQISIDEIGREGQDRLKKSKVLIFGAGGLGSPAALYLAAAGVGTLKIVDNDTVTLNNLNRQILHGDTDIGELKVDSARRRLTTLNSRIVVETSASSITSKNAADIMKGCCVAVDALDNFETRYVVNKVAVEHNIPLVHGAVEGFEGRALTVVPGRGACLRCMHGESPEPSEFSVAGVAPAVIGAVQAAETVKLLLGMGKPLVNRLIVFDALDMKWTEFSVKPDPECSHCGHLQDRGTFNER